MAIINKINVGGTDYEIGGGKSYLHKIEIQDSETSMRVFLTLTLSSATPITTISGLYSLVSTYRTPCTGSDEDLAPDEYVGFVMVYPSNATAYLTSVTEENEHQVRYFNFKNFNISDTVVAA